jgi:sirohydrochlorin ferrochelatase
VTAVVLLAHGSPDPRSGAAVRAAAARLDGRDGRAVHAAFLDHDAPRPAEVVAALPDERVVVLPLLLSRAFHARVDVPRAVADLARPVELLDPLGHPADVLDALLRQADGPVVVASAGTRVDTERTSFADAVAAASRRTGVPASPAHLTGPGPSVPDALAGLEGASLLAWLLAPGRLLDALHELARPSGRPVLAPDGLLGTASFDEVLLHRLGLPEVADLTG